jgi:exosortase A-associated hydrolase 2
MKTDNTLTEFFFIDTNWGKLFCALRHNDPSVKNRGKILFIHPFGDEMNKARKMVAIQSSELTKLGYSVMQVDLYGCGDSSGEFKDANWEIWVKNVRSAVNFLENLNSHKIFFWGLRLGALLVLDYITRQKQKSNKIILWQPTLIGLKYINQQLRMNTYDKKSQPKSILKSSMEMEKGEYAKIGGYSINHELYNSIVKLNIENFVKPEKIKRIEWFEISPVLENQLTFASGTIVKLIEDKRIKINARTLNGPPFWATTEISVVEKLVKLTNLSVKEW